MANVCFNVVKGRHTHYATLPGVNDALIAVPLESAGLEADNALRDHTTLSALLAGASNEQTVMGRKMLTGVTVTVDDANDWQVVDAADITWTAASGNPVGALLICYDPDTSTGTDTDIIPLYKYDFTVTPNGTDVVAVINAAGLARAT